MSDDTTHQGWKNYPTWAVSLWLSNDEGLYGAAVERARDVLAMRHPTTDYWTVEESRRYNLADDLKTWVTDELSPYLDASFAADLYGWALEQVDWNELADAWIESASDA